ncbi:prepilin-type N-terminal cleavage/methylation domain-containing protein [Candidatus Poribacteria bacterium]
MMKLFRKTESGFSLVELMIVVAIIAILAAIAIPAFMRFAMKSKTAEATGNLVAIRTCQESYRAENDVYYITGGAIAPALGGTDSTPDPWLAAGVGEIAFAVTGFSADGDVRFNYQVVAGAAGALTADAADDPNNIIGGFSVIATGDLDENGVPSTYTIDTSVAGYPKPVHVGDY